MTFFPESLRPCPPVLILTAHGSADPRSSATTYAVADEIRMLRPDLDVAVAFCENSEPNLRDVLTGLDGPAVVTPLLLASAYHARIDIPGIIADATTGPRARIAQADTLGEDPRLVEVMRQRLAELGVSPECPETGILVVAVGSSHAAANARTATLAASLTEGTGWAGVRVAHATGTHAPVSEGIAELRAQGADRIVLAPWFIAPGRITDRVAYVAEAEKVEMAQPLGAHRLVAMTALERFARAVARRQAA